MDTPQIPTSGGVTQGVNNGFYLGNRSGASAAQTYVNGSDIGLTAVNSTALSDRSMAILGSNAATRVGGGYQISAASIGGSLTSGQVTSFYNRLRTYMTAVGVS